MHVSQIRAGAEEVELFERRILGRAEGLDDNFDSASTEFTDVIKWNVDTESDIQFEIWMNVCKSLRFCAAITEEWADSLSEYKQERRRIINRWNTEASALEEDLNHTPLIDLVAFDSKSDKAATALNRLKDDLETDESRAYSNLDTKATDARSDLAYGATPDAVQRLIDGGYFNWAYFNLGGDIESIPIDIEGDQAAEDLVDFAEDPENYGGDISEITAILNNIGLVAAGRQDNDQTLDSDSLEFLREFYDSLEESGNEYEGTQGVLRVAGEIVRNQDINSEDRNHILGGLGGGILALSDEDLMGGYEALPPSVKEAVEGPESNEPPAFDWQMKANFLSQMMEHTNSEIKGGEQFSVNLTQSIAYALGGEGSENLGSSKFEHLIDVSTRNEDANYAILTGSGEYEHPTHGLDPEMTLKNVYTFDWEDDGAAASGITDWIWEQSTGDNSARAGEAMESFMQLFEDPEFVNAISGTGHDVRGEVTDDDGNTVETTWRDASAGHLNPDIAWGWSELFSAYKEEFASEYGTPIGNHDTSGETIFDAEDGLKINPDQRANFVQQIMGDGNAGARVYAETIEYNIQKLEEFVGGRDSIDTSGAARAGILRGIVDSALSGEAELRQSNNETGAEHEQKIKDYGVDMLGAALSEIPAPGSSLASEAIKIGGKESFDIETFDAEQMNENNIGDWEIHEMFELAAARALVADDPDISGVPESVKDDSSEETRVHPDPNSWNSEDIYEDRRELWRAVRNEDWGASGEDAEQASVDYTDAFLQAREKMNESVEVEENDEE